MMLWIIQHRAAAQIGCHLAAPALMFWIAPAVEIGCGVFAPQLSTAHAAFLNLMLPYLALLTVGTGNDAAAIPAYSISFRRARFVPCSQSALLRGKIPCNKYFLRISRCDIRQLVYSSFQEQASFLL
jgi:hypothetical protein